MSLEINKKGLSGQAVKIIDNAILKADLDNSGKIDNEKEQLLFNYEIDSSDVLTKSEKKQILGKKEVKEDSEAKQARQEKRADRREEKGCKAVFTETLDTFAKDGMKRDQVVKELRAALITEKLPQSMVDEYNQLITVVEEVLAIMPKEYERMNDIDSKLKDIKSKFDENDALHRDVLRSLRQMAKNEKINGAYVDITNRFAAEVLADKEAGKQRNDEQIMDKILEDLRKEGLYIDESTKGKNYRETYQNEYVTAYDSYVKSDVMKDARVLLTQVIMGNDEDVKTGKVLKKARKFLEDNGFYDKYVKKADKQGRYGRKTSRAQALDNKVELNTVQREKDILGVLNDNTQRAKLTALMSVTTTLLDSRGDIILDENGEPKQFNLITKREDGYYDVSVLSALVGEGTGVDKTRNKYSRQKAVSELTRIIGNVNKNLVGTAEGLQLTKEEVLDLIDLLGYDTKGSAFNWLKAGLGVVLGALTHGGAAAAATWSNPYQGILFEPERLDDIVIDQPLETILGEEATQFLQKNGYDITVDISGNIKTIITDIFTGDQAYGSLVPKLIGVNGVKAAVLGGILGLLNGFQETEEISVGSIKIEDATLEDYANRLKAEKNKHAKLFTSIAVAFGYVDEKGNLDREGLSKFLGNVLAGNDTLNKDELKRAVQLAYNAEYTHRLLEKPEAKAEEAEIATQNEPTPIENKIDVEAEVKPVTVEKPEEFTWTHEHTWQAVVMAYYPEALGKGSYKELKAAVDAFRDAHGIGRQQGIPVGQKSQLVPITINGVTYQPNKNGSDNMDKALVKYGWNSDFFLQKWDVKLEAPRLTIKEYKDGEKTVYYGVRTNADGTEVKSGPLDSSDAVVKELTPQASSEADIKLTITIKDKDGKVEKQETKTIKKVEK